MGIMKVAQYPTFLLLSAVGSWHCLGFSLLMCSIHLGLSGRSKHPLILFLSLCVLFIFCSTSTALWICIFNLLFRTVEDFRDWTNWLFYRGGIGVKGEESWEAWWDEELVFCQLLRLC